MAPDKQKSPKPPVLTPAQRQRAGRMGGVALWRKIRAGEMLGPPAKKKRGRKITFKGMGKRGGKSRAQTLTPERRSEIARMGGLARKKKLDAQRQSEQGDEQKSA